MGEATPGWNLKQVAAALGVHYRTAYRYVREGRLPATMVAGGWRVDPAEVARLIGDGDPTPAPARHVTLSSMLERGDEPGAWAHLVGLLGSGCSIEACLCQVLPAGLAGVGVDGPDDLDGMARSYVATATATRLVDRLSARCVRPGRTRGTVMLVGPSGEHHRLPLATVAALVRLGGYRSIELGTDVAPGVVVAATTQHDLLAVGIGVTTAASVDAAAATVSALRAARPSLAVVVGGQAVRNPEVARLMGARWWAPDGPGMVTVLDGLRAAQRHRDRAGRAR